jgi:hypothetical protein
MWILEEVIIKPRVISAAGIATRTSIHLEGLKVEDVLPVVQVCSAGCMQFHKTVRILQTQFWILDKVTSACTWKPGDDDDDNYKNNNNIIEETTIYMW